MSCFNKVIVMGNLTKDPELRYTSSGTAVGKLTLALTRVWRNGDGEKMEETTFADIDVYGKQAETISKYMTKGRPILIEGRLHLNVWEKDGEKRSKLMVVCEKFQFTSGSSATREDS